MKLPRKPQYVLVELDADMVPPKFPWPERERILTFHHFGRLPLKRGDRVCVNDGEFKDAFGTVKGRSWRWSGYSFGVRRTKRKTITVNVPKQIEVEVA